MLTTQKHLFDLPEEITYLNIAAQSPSFKAVTKAGIEGLVQKSQPHRITGDDYFEPVNTLKQLFAKCIDASAYQRVVTIPSVSYGMATIANNIKLNKDDEIIVIEGQFPSNMYVWIKLAEKYSAKIITIAEPRHEKGRGLHWNQHILEAISDKTALVAIGNIHWSNGIVFDLKAIRKKTKEHNALLVVDGSQTIGAYPFSVQEIQPDALVCAGYKWLFGPYGCAYAYFGPYFDDGDPIEENWSNRLNSENFAGLTNYESRYKPLAHRYNVGQSGNFIYVKMQIAALTQILQWHPNELQDYCKAITMGSVIKLQEKGFLIDEPEYRTHHLFGILLPDNCSIDRLKKQLLEDNIYVSFRGNYIRVSAHVYNTKEDFEKLYQSISKVM